MSREQFHKDLKWSTRASLQLAPWYDQLANSASLPPINSLAKEKRLRRKLLKGAAPRDDTRLSLQRRERQFGKRKNWIRCTTGSMRMFFQEQHDVDVVAYVGYLRRLVTIEEKIRRGTDYVNDLAFEVLSNSNVGRETPGWGVYSNAEWMLYVYVDTAKKELICKLLDLQKLKRWAWRKIAKVGGIDNIESDLRWHKIVVRDQENHTISYGIPYDEMPEGTVLKEFTLSTRSKSRR